MDKPEKNVALEPASESPARVYGIDAIRPMPET